MTFEAFLFYFFSVVLVGSAVAVITVRNPVHAALFLVLAFVATAAHWIMLEAEFLGILLVLVYVGAVMVLFLFVVMMLDINMSRIREGFMKLLPVGIVVAVGMMVVMAMVVGAQVFQVEPPVPASADYSNTEALGQLLYTEYVYPFEIAAVILLVAIIAAIVLTLRKRPDTRYLDPAKQIQIRREDRVRMVKMESEKK
ncbi:NADH:ubiquinone oxidoreductase subunit J [Ectothiorhodospira haloalkaliphila]|uniref:NADH-quinone oxidoreductase subunit J n=2 Tax=Ectothiorhodospira TaxID=1051 RepID=W8KFM2_9GAMM|nr:MULTISPECIES: NADH-quinone oxidoreductase subunit J [Ectothiorhodospira]TVQ72286.1 MAG: NADH-quinone oxidoreductase subunit J [Chromatiaceae bacterium]AHK78579.1 NADH:ubiquinone oxidoreductase subunit J [Ectothiorhodospira haloalkaliphila]MCG5493184.1 NADH-quinone oxidoreductase subunit J [Ectothiorhodospira variabilis]MCG5497094.1 NADH-quinone oxidoreductase subunit J [Ectothiorhodospira variabilis]MCG5502513.1 NADH-quinone oxidoreductase subunit J [Ectothiorhodospira variabilis]